MHVKCICNLHREVEVIQPLTESYWDPEKYCLTYNKDGNTYELYDEQQILYPVCVIVYVCCLYVVGVCILWTHRQGINPVKELCGAPLL